MVSGRPSRKSALSVLVFFLLTTGCGRASEGGGDASRTRTTSPGVSASPFASHTTLCASPERPVARSSASMAYMPNLGQAVLFGGWSNAIRGYLSDTWTWQSGCWTLHRLSVAPSPRVAMAITYDPIRKVVVAFGGRIDPSLPNYSSETWAWDGQSWSQTVKGPALAESWAAFDVNLQRVLLYGWANGATPQTWTWDGAQWHQLDVANPPARSGAGVAFDPASHSVLLFGGVGLETMTLLNDTWAWNGTAWSKLNPTHSPSPRQAFAMAPLSGQREVLLIGGNTQHGFVDDAWIWNGSDWSQSTGIGARADASAIDIGSGVVLFGGEDLTSEKNDVDIWDGSTWTTT
jgi:hypothetical protein